MNKDQLQKELKEKIKAGIKPSDLKKQSKKQAQKDNLPSPIVSDKDEGYESDKSIPKAPPNNLLALQKQIELHQEIKKADERKKQELQEKIKTLIKLAGEEKQEYQQKISDLQKQVQDLDYLLKTGKNSDIINKLQAKIKEQDKIIEELKNQVKSKGNDKEPNKLFTCSQCQQEWSTEFLKLVDPQGNKTCVECLENMLELTKKETGKEIIIEEPTPEKVKPCQFCRNPFKVSQLKPRHITNLPNHDPREITLICQECLIYRAKKADYYCPLINQPRDLYQGKEFDCYCPIK